VAHRIHTDTSMVNASALRQAFYSMRGAMDSAAARDSRSA